MSPDTCSSMGPALPDEPPVIEVKNLTKEYRLGALEGLRATARRLLGKPSGEPKRQFKALDDVSFTIKRGEVVGIIGHNGAGKSTLLKHLCRITTPTSGSVTVRGRVAPLIEVGAGLVGDMTGRENIYLNATILGLSRADIEFRVPEIIEFAELEQFIDTPVKRYSSGMQVRLGFSIATAVLPDILIVDEVLAVGDVAFQRKCIDRMELVKRDPQRTMLIVGHNIRQLERICDRMLVLQSGRVVMDGESSEVSSNFYRLMLERSDGTRDASPPDRASGSEVEVISAVISQDGKHSEEDQPFEVESCEQLVVSLELQVNRAVLDAEINIGFHNQEMIFAIKASTRTADKRLDLEPGRQVLRFTVPMFNLSPGPYGLGIGVYDRFRRSIWSTTAFKWIDVTVTKRRFVDLPIGTLTYSLASWEFDK